jgi:phage terminase large subunit GpA-like protein
MNKNTILTIGTDWLIEEIEALTDEIIHVRPSDFNEDHRYLPESVTSIPGPIRYDVNPFMREIVDCFDVESPVREVNLKKGVQITYTTLLESGLLYFMGHVKTLPVMYLTADKELAAARVENNIIPMINQSGFAGIVRSSDETSKRKTGKTANHIQWEGGGYLVPYGANNANKMRSYSICVMLKDEIDAWPEVVGKDGDPEALTDDRCSAYWERRKIFRGSTPLIKGASKIDKAYLRGDQRKYMVRCVKCGYSQELRWSGKNKKTNTKYGFAWDLEDDSLILESVRYHCQNCVHPHYEHDKEKLFATDQGAKWEPTARPAEPNIRSYHLPALYSPIGMQPWYKSVAMYLKAFDTEERKVKDIGAFQVFYNNVLAESFEVMGSKIQFSQVSAHRRSVYRLGEIPNQFAEKFSGSKILFLTCVVDVHKDNLAVGVFGWTKDARCYLVDYWRFEDTTPGGCEVRESLAWSKLQELIEEKVYRSKDGRQYRICLTLIDAGYQNELVCNFCNEYEGGVYPVLGRERPSKSQRIQEFSEFTTQIGTVGYRVLVDHYKDRLAPILRRDWIEAMGTQKPYQFNAGIDTSDKQLKELTKEIRREKRDDRGNVSYEWYRPGNARNELWDLLVYGHAGVEILAWSICIQHFELETIEWDKFWEFLESNGGVVGRTD